MNQEQIKALARKIEQTYKEDHGINFIDVNNLPQKSKILEITDNLLELLFPGYAGSRRITKSNIIFIVGDILCQVQEDLMEQIERALRHKCRKESCSSTNCNINAREVTNTFLAKLPTIRETLKTDVAAAYDGDPAAQSFEEIVISYPGLFAITVHRLAHELYEQNVPMIPRIMSEYAHRETGIDIHPGATIGKNFFIDHGTGVVIGETAIIGDNVKIYQGVTLGAMSFPKDERGRIIKGGKRHPTIEDDVTIYAEATILGDIVVGKGAVVAGNVWVKESVSPGDTVFTASPELLFKHKKN